MPGPNKNFESISTENFDNILYASQFDGSSGSKKIQNAIGTAESMAGDNAVVCGPIGPDNPSSAPESDVWEVTSVIDPPSGTDLIGIGKPLLYLADDFDNDIIRTAVDASGSVTTDVRIEGVRLHGNVSNHPSWDSGGSNFGTDPDNGATSGSGNRNIKGLVGIRPVNCAGWVVEDCHFLNWPRFGYCEKLSQGMMTVRDCVGDTYFGDDAFTISNQFHQVSDADDVLHVFDNIEAANGSDQAVEIEDGVRHVIVRDSLLRDSPAGANVKTHPNTNELPCDDVRWINCDFINNTLGIAINAPYSDDSDGHIIKDCWFEGQSSRDIVLRGGSSERIRNVKIKDTTIELTDSEAITSVMSGGLLEDVTVEGVTVNCRANITTGNAAPIQFEDAEIRNLSIGASVYGNGNTTTFGIDVRSNSGPVSDVTILDETHVEGMGYTGLQLRTGGDPLTHATISGTYKNNGQQGSNVSDDLRGGIKLDNNSGALTDVILGSVHAYDDQGTKTQDYGIIQRGDYHVYDSCNLRGNKTSPFRNAFGSNSIIKEVRGFSTEFSGTVADALDLTVTGVTTVNNVPHNLDQTPNVEDIEVEIISPDANDWDATVTNIKNINTNNFDVDINVTSASGGSTVQGDIKYRVKAPAAT